MILTVCCLASLAPCPKITIPFMYKLQQNLLFFFQISYTIIFHTIRLARFSVSYIPITVSVVWAVTSPDWHRYVPASLAITLTIRRLPLTTVWRGAWRANPSEVRLIYAIPMTVSCNNWKWPPFHKYISCGSNVYVGLPITKFIFAFHGGVF